MISKWCQTPKFYDFTQPEVTILDLKIASQTRFSSFSSRARSENTHIVTQTSYNVNFHVISGCLGSTFSKNSHITRVVYDFAQPEVAILDFKMASE